ncbi:MAG: recombinase family protein [Hylemonella sp.]
MLIGYARVSTNEQSTAVQLSAFQRHGVVTVYEEKQSSIKRRPVLEHLLADVLRPGDVLVVYKLDRLARSMAHFVSVFDRLKARGVGFKSLTESIETETPQGRMFLQLLGVFAEFERELIRERCLAGQIAARARGQTWGKPRIFTRDEAKQFAAMWRSGWFYQHTLADMFDVNEATIRDYIHWVENRGRWATSPTMNK